VFGSGDNWLTVSKLFTPLYHVFLVDQRNHGRSPHSDTFNYDALVEDLKDFADQQNLPVFDLIGHSMGGKVAMKFAAKYPDRLSKMVVVDIAPRFYSPHHQEIMNGFKSVDLKAMVSRQEAEEAMIPFIPELDVRQFLLKNLYRNTDGEFAWRINLPVLEKGINQIGEALSIDFKISIPTLFIKGKKSIDAPPFCFLIFLVLLFLLPPFNKFKLTFVTHGGIILACDFVFFVCHSDGIKIVFGFLFKIEYAPHQLNVEFEHIPPTHCDI
jgi:pimeloyl-ACP methyl ester carboxylesterase